MREKCARGAGEVRKRCGRGVDNGIGVENRKNVKNRQERSNAKVVRRTCGGGKEVIMGD